MIEIHIVSTNLYVNLVMAYYPEPKNRTENRIDTPEYSKLIKNIIFYICRNIIYKKILKKKLELAK